MAASVALGATTINTVVGPDPGPYGVDRIATVTVAFNGPITVIGLPRVAMTIGTTTRYALYSSATADNKLLFRYTTVMGDNGVLKLDSKIDLNGGRIQDASGVDVAVTFVAPDTSNVIFDTTAPAAPVITSAAQTATPGFRGTAEPGSGLEIHEDGGSHYGGQITVAADGTWQTGWILGPLPAGTYYFYAITRDPAGNFSPRSADVAVVVPASPDQGTGGTPGAGPTIAQAFIPGSGGYTNGSVEFTVRYSAPVFVTGTPRILMTIGGSPRYANYISGSGTTDLGFRYMVVHNYDNGWVAFGNTIELNGGTIRDAADHDANLTFTPSDTPKLYADGVPPPPPVITSITQSATPTLTGTAEPYSRVNITIAGMGGAAVATLGSQGNGWRYDWYDTPIPAGTYTVRVTATDAAYNVSDQSNAVTLVVPPADEPGGRDITPPKETGWKPAVVDPAQPTVAKFWLGFTEPVTGFDASDVVVTTTGDAHATVNPLELADPTGASYYIPVTFSGTGTITLRVPGGTDANIRDLAGNLFGNGQDSYVSFELPTPNAPVISSPLFVTATVGVPFSYTVTATGSPTSYGASTPATATWLTWDPATHTLSGTPTESTVLGVSLAATNSAGIGNAGLTIDIHAADGTSGGLNNQPPVVTDAIVSGHVGEAIAPVQVKATGSPTIFKAPDLAFYGLTIDRTGTITGTPTARADGVVVSVVAANPAGDSQPAKITLNIVGGDSSSGGSGGGNGNGTGNGNPNGTGNGNGGGNANNVPVLTDTVVNGQVGLTLKPVQVPATGSPTAWYAPGLALYGLSIDHDGVITGIPTAVASGFTVGVTASNVYGTSAPADITLNISTAGGTSADSQPAVKVTSDHAVDLGASASAAPVSYTVVSGPAAVVNDQLVFTGSGTVVVKATQALSGAQTGEATLRFAAVPVDRLVNLSSRMHVDGTNGANPSIVGFVITGDSPKQMLVRAVGPTLSDYGVTDGAPDPRLTLFDSSGKQIAANAGWNGDKAIADASNAVGAFKLHAGSKDAALLATLAPGAYTAVVTAGASGTVLVEVYDAAANAAVPTKQLVNISARGTVLGGDDALIGGFVVNGTESKRVLIRGIGPTLTGFGVAGALSDPMLTLYTSSGAVVAQNENWETPQPTDAAQHAASAAEIVDADTKAGAFALNAGSTDAALVVTLPPGAYSAVVTGRNGATGGAMVEVYELPAE